MTFDARHYVPVLKAKRAEKMALSLLPSSVCAAVTPLLEIVERKERPLGKHLDTAFRGAATSVRRFERCFILRPASNAPAEAARSLVSWGFSRAFGYGSLTSPKVR